MHTRSGERKLQHNDKVWEHNGLSSAQTEARTSLALKGQQASPGFHSVPPVIIVQHYNDYSDGLYFANVGAIRKYQWNMKMQARPERRGEKRLLILEGELLWRQVSHGLAQPWIGLQVHQRSLVSCQLSGHLLVSNSDNECTLRQNTSRAPHMSRAEVLILQWKCHEDFLLKCYSRQWEWPGNLRYCFSYTIQTE